MSRKKWHKVSKKNRELCDNLQKEYQIFDTAGEELLSKIGNLEDYIDSCEEIIKKQGLVILDRFGVAKPHPVTVTLRDARSQLLHYLKALNLDLEPLKERPKTAEKQYGH